MWKIFSRFQTKSHQSAKPNNKSKQNIAFDLINENHNNDVISTESTHREGETQLYFTCPNCGVNVSVPEEHRDENNLICYYCKKSFNNPLIEEKNKVRLNRQNITQEYSDENNDLNIEVTINTESTHREGEAQLYFTCPNCGVNVSVPEEHRDEDNLICYYCKKSFNNPLLKKSKKEELDLIDVMNDENHTRYKIIKPIIKKYYDKCDISKQASISMLYSYDNIFNLVEDDNLDEVTAYTERLHASVRNDIDSGNYDNLDDSLSLLSELDTRLNFLKDLNKIYKLIKTKNINTTYPELIKLFYELFQNLVNKENEIILNHEYLRIAAKLFSNISVRTVLKEFIKTPLDLQVNKKLAKLLLDRFNLEFNIEELDSLIEELYEEIELEEFEQSLEKQNSPEILLNPEELNGLEFEDFLKQLFEILGYTVIRTKASGDQGADLILTLNNIKTAVQAKRYSGKVSNKAIQEVVASKKHYKCENAMVVTTGKFTKSAVQLAISNEVELWDIKKLSKIISDINNSNKKNSIKNNENTSGNEPIKTNMKINLNNETIPFICPMCKKEINADVDILPDINKGSSFECPECNFPFMLRLDVENYSCEHCHKQFKSIREHINHLKVCSVYKSKLYICDSCNAELILDDEEYEEYKKYGLVNTVCPICNKNIEMRK